MTRLHQLSIPINVQTERMDRYLDEGNSDETIFLTPTDLELKNLANPDFFPGASVQMNPLQVLAARNASTKEHFGPIMASYRSNVSFRETRENKLFADIKSSSSLADAQASARHGICGTG